MRVFQLSRGTPSPLADFPEFAGWLGATWVAEPSRWTWIEGGSPVTGFGPPSFRLRARPVPSYASIAKLAGVASPRRRKDEAP